MRIHRNSLRNFLLAAVTLLLAAVFVSSSLAAPGRGSSGPGGAKPSGKIAGGPQQRRTLMEAWKQSQRARGGRAVKGAQAFGGSPSVGRPSMVINGSGSVLYTKQFAGSACDLDPASATFWFPSTAYLVNDIARPVTGGANFFYRATNSGTSGATEPVWPIVNGATVVNGTITWQAEFRQWTASQAFPAGAVILPGGGIFNNFGFQFLAVTGGTTGATVPQWPTTIGATVGDGTVIWKAIGFFPGTTRGCDPMQLVTRASGGAETVNGSEGDPVGGAGSQLSGWAEFYAMNSVGQAALRTSVIGRLTDEDESGTGILMIGPGPAINEAAASNTIIGGRGVCGFGGMTAINDAGQILFDGYLNKLPRWKANTPFPASSLIIPTSGIGVPFRTVAGGTTGPTEPVWPQTIGTTVNDNDSVTWVAEAPRNYCNENQHGMYRFTPGGGNQLLIAVGTDVGGGTTVVGFGNDVNTSVSLCSGCNYEDLDGYLTPSGHASVTVRLSTDDTAAYLLTGPLTFTQVARTGAPGPGGAFGRVYPRTEVNAADQVLFKAQVGGVDKLIRWTAPSTFAVVASVGDDIGTRSGGAASGTTLTALGFYGDINGPGNVVFQGTLSSGPKAYFFWDGATGLLTEIAREGGAILANLASEMVTINDLNVVAFTSGAGLPEQPEEPSELDEKGLHLWTKVGGIVNVVRVGDVIGGLTVSSVNAQHPSFRQRQLSSAGCTAVQYFVNGVTGGATEDASEGSGAAPRDQGVPPAGQLIVQCAGVVPVPTPTPTVTAPGPTPTVTRTPTVTPVPPPGSAPASPIPTLSPGMLALFALALAAASLLFVMRKH